MAVRILHFADLHLDKAFTDVATISRDVARRRRSDLRRVLTRIVDLVAEFHVDYLTVAGDLYEHERLSPDTAAFIRNEFERAQPAIVIIAPGNHDPFTVDSPYKTMEWPPNVRIAQEPAIRLMASELGVHLYAAAHPNPSFMSDVVQGIRVETPKPNLLVLHGSLRTAVPPGVVSFCPISASDCSMAGFGLALLGHYHSPSRQQYESVIVAYPGSPDPLGFSEVYQHGVLLAEVEGDQIALSCHDIHVAEYRTGELDVSGASSRRDIEAMIEQWADAFAMPQALVRITLVGTIAPSLDLDLTAIRTACEDKFALLDLRANTNVEPEIDPDEPTVRGRFVRKMLRLMQDVSSEEERQEMEKALLYGLAALERREIRAR